MRLVLHFPHLTDGEAEALRGKGWPKWQEAAQAWYGQALDCDAGAMVAGSVLIFYCIVPPSSQVGFINSLKFSSTGDFLVAGVGQEHRYEAPLQG